jgi:para-nitrobenzyl esterase
LWGSSQQNDFTKLIARARKGLVVVQVNYRMNLFGFLAIKELSAEQGGSSGNYGIMDQILALQWVQDNIRSFSKCRYYVSCL